MLKVGIKELTLENFQNYGAFVNLLKPKTFHFGEPPIQFFRDMLQLTLDQAAPASFSVNTVQKREPVVVKSEYHSRTGEGILPLDGDILIHCAPATRPGIFPKDDIEIFHVPRLTLVALKPGVWHHAPFAYKCDSVHILIVLPERTYANDCTVLELKEDERIQIAL